MAEESSDGKNISVSVPMGALATAVVLGLVAVAYTLMNRDGDDSESGSSKAKSGSVRRRLGLLTFITLIENDATRRLIIAVLRAIARRA